MIRQRLPSMGLCLQTHFTCLLLLHCLTTSVYLLVFFFLGAFCESISTQIFILEYTSGNLNLRLFFITITSSVQVTIIFYTVLLQQASCYLFPRFFNHDPYHLRVTWVTLDHGHPSQGSLFYSIQESPLCN